MKTCIAVLIAAVLCMLLADGAPAREYSKDFQKSFDVREGFCLRLEHGDGDVTVRTWDRDVLDVAVHYRVDGRSFGLGNKHDFEVEFTEDDGLIEIIGREPRSRFIGIKFYESMEYTYTIHAPRYLELDFRGDDGNVDIEGWRGEIECKLDDGNVTFVNVASPRAKIHLEDGDVEIERHAGTLAISGEDGDVTISDSSIPECRIELEDGDIEISDSEGNCDIGTDDGNVELRRFRGGTIEIAVEDGDVDIGILDTDDLDLDVTTSDGNVTLEIDPSVSASFTIDVDDGLIRLDAPSAVKVQKGRRWTSGEIGDGTGRIKIKTSDGRVIFKVRD
jgi:hypothetical protein